MIEQDERDGNRQCRYNFISKCAIKGLFRSEASAVSLNVFIIFQHFYFFHSSSLPENIIFQSDSLSANLTKLLNLKLGLDINVSDAASTFYHLVATTGLPPRAHYQQANTLSPG